MMSYGKSLDGLLYGVKCGFMWYGIAWFRFEIWTWLGVVKDVVLCGMM